MRRSRTDPRTRAGRTKPVRRRWGARLAVVTGLAAVGLALVAPSAGANYGRIDAEVGCDRIVSWTASASTEGDEEKRTNLRVQVEFRPVGSGEGGWGIAGVDGRFDADNDFRFSGTFELPGDADAVELRVTPLEPWGVDGDGDAPGEPRFTRAEIPASCGEQPVVLRLVEDCDTGAARVDVRTEADAPGPVEVDVEVDRVLVRTLALEPGADASLVVPLLVGAPSELRVAAGDFVLSERPLGGQCPTDGSAAILLERCGPGDAVAVADGGEEGAALRIRVDGTIVHTATIDAGGSLQRTLNLPGDPVAVEVTLDGETAAAATVGACEGELAGALSCGTGSRTACRSSAAPTTVPPPPPPPPPLTLELDEGGLPRTGPWQRAVALLAGGALLSIGGMSLLAGDRRRPRPSMLAGALAPYRQRWWDDR